MRRVAVIVAMAVGVLGLGGDGVRAEAPPDVFLAGADARSIVPDRDGDGEPDLDDIYLGGFGLGPYRVFDQDYEPIAYVGPENRLAEDVHPLGIWVRSVAFGNDHGETVVVQSLDLQGYFLGFKGCDCGVSAIQDRFAEATGLAPETLLVHATHQHAGPNVLGHQGGTPSWYLEQIRDQAVASAVAAVEALEPAHLGVGKVHLPQYNRHRRDTYQSVVDDTLVYLHATRPTDGSTVATLVNYAAHPTVIGSSNRTIHPDYPGPLVAVVEQELGGTAVYLNGAVGNVSPQSPAGSDHFERAWRLGESIALEVSADVARGTKAVRGDQVAVDVREMLHPITNPVLLAGSAAHVYMRSDELMTVSLDPIPYPTGIFPLRVVTHVAGFRIGDALVLSAPGEIFGGMSVAARNQMPWTSATLVAGMGNDHVGYIMQNHEYKVAQVQEYEETQSLDPWVGDHVVDLMIDVGRALEHVPAHEPTQDVVLVGSKESGEVTVVDAETFEKLKVIDVIPDGGRREVTEDPLHWASQPAANTLAGVNYLQSMDVSPDGRTLYVSRGHTGDVAAFDIATGALRWTVPISGLRSDHLMLSADGRHLFVSAITLDTVEVVDTKTASVVASFPTGEFPHGLRPSPDGARVYNGSIGNVFVPRELDEVRRPYQLTIADAQTFEVERQIPFDRGIRPFVVMDDERTMFAQLSFLHGFVEFDLETEQVVRTVELPVSEAAAELDEDDYPFEAAHHGLAVSPDGSRLCVAATVSNYIGLVSRPDFELEARIEVGDEPASAANSPDGRYCFVTVRLDDSVSVVSYADGEEVARIDVPGHPQPMRPARIPVSALAG